MKKKSQLKRSIIIFWLEYFLGNIYHETPRERNNHFAMKSVTQENLLSNEVNDAQRKTISNCYWLHSTKLEFLGISIILCIIQNTTHLKKVGKKRFSNYIESTSYNNKVFQLLTLLWRFGFFEIPRENVFYSLAKRVLISAKFKYKELEQEMKIILKYEMNVILWAKKCIELFSLFFF